MCRSLYLKILGRLIRRTEKDYEKFALSMIQNILLISI